MSDQLQLSELFHSVQGEGELTGTSSVFVRTTGCNLRCWFCDTPYTSWKPEGYSSSLDEVIEQVTQFDCQHVVITGGEPMLQSGVVPLTQSLKERDIHITIETAGTVHLPVHASLMSISPKLANSTPDHTTWGPKHDETRHRPDVIRQLISEYNYQLKFVIDQPADVDDVKTYLNEFPKVKADRVWLMPQGILKAELDERMAWLTEVAEKLGFHVSPRMHIEWFGNTRGT